MHAFVRARVCIEHRGGGAGEREGLDGGERRELEARRRLVRQRHRQLPLRVQPDLPQGPVRD